MRSVTLHVARDHSIAHASYVYTGLLEMARSGVIDLHLASAERSRDRKTTPGVATVQVDIGASVGSSTFASLCFDLTDSATLFDSLALQRCDLYFKRSYSEERIAQLSAAEHTEVQPFGITFPCRPSDPWPVFQRLWASALRAVRRSGAADSLQAAAVARTMLQYMRLPALRALECAASAPKEPRILYQPRLWESNDVSGGLAADVNQQRVQIVAALARAFPRRFIGGLVPTPLAMREHRSLVSRLAPRDYLRALRGSLIGIYTRGLHSSTAWKFGEYLASSTCVVGEPLEHELSAPVVEGQHYLPFRSVDACVAACDHLLTHPTSCESMRAAAAAYYKRHGSPLIQIQAALSLV